MLQNGCPAEAKHSWGGLKSAPHLNTCLYGASFLLESIIHALKVEGGVILIQRIPYPEIYLAVALLQAEAAVERAVELLAGAVALRPVDASGGLVVGV